MQAEAQELWRAATGRKPKLTRSHNSSPSLLITRPHPTGVRARLLEAAAAATTPAAPTVLGASSISAASPTAALPSPSALSPRTPSAAHPGLSGGRSNLLAAFRAPAEQP